MRATENLFRDAIIDPADDVATTWLSNFTSSGSQTGFILYVPIWGECEGEDRKCHDQIA
jgi:hypothetical protein